MDILNVTNAFSALSQDMRLEVFRLLIKAGQEGCLAGEIGQALNVKQNTMSANLTVLLNAKLVVNKREGRNIRYFANYETLAALLTFLMEDCCGGKSEQCRPAIESILGCCDQTYRKDKT